MPPRLTPRCRGPGCGGNAPLHAHGPMTPGRRFGHRPGVFGTWPGIGHRPGSPIAPPPIVPRPVRPPGVPMTPPPIIHPPGGPPPSYPPSSYPPPSYPPPSAPYPSGGHVADRRTHAPDAPPFDPMADAGYDASGEVPWGYADDGSASADPAQLESGSPAFDLWQGLLGSHLETRNAAASTSGEAYPETTAGDVRRASLALSRELCLPRYDFADLTATRAAWRDALTRVHALCARVPWSALYPENERFWLSDALALAQRLAAVDARRNGITHDAANDLQLVGDHSDPIALWNDLRQFFLARRLVRRGTKATRGGEGFRYPETNVRDVAQVVQTIGAASAQAAPLLGQHPELRTRYERLARAWWDTVERVSQQSEGRARGDVYPDNERFWLADTKRMALQLSVLRDAVPSGYRFPSAGGAW